MDWQRAASCRRGLSPPESGAGSIPSECSERSATWWRLDASPPSFVTSGGSEKHGKDSLNIFVLRARSLDALRRAGVTTVGQARSLSQQDLLRVTNIGPKSVADLNRALGEQILGPEDLLSSLAIPRPLFNRDRTIVHMHASGVGHTAIARQIGISRIRVAQILDRAEQSSA